MAGFIWEQNEEEIEKIEDTQELETPKKKSKRLRNMWDMIFPKN